MLALFGFQANVEQTASSLLGIRLMISVIAGIGALIAVAFLYFYKLDEDLMNNVEKELEAARAGEQSVG